MGGKRPDQHNIDPGEAGATNYKWRGEGRSQGEKLKEEAKQEFQAHSKDDRSFIPESGVNPAAADHRARRMAGEHPDEGKADASSGSDSGSSASASGSSSSGSSGRSGKAATDKVDEASEESFPASDPPAY